MKENLWHNRNLNEIFAELNSSEKGLITEEAINRINKYGKNVLPKAKKLTLFKIFISQFNNPIIFILLISIVLSFLIGEKTDGLFIMLVILIDVVFGTFQEWKAEKNSETLEKLIRVQVKVLRNNKMKIIDSEDLTIGDVIILESGDKISADARIFECTNLKINEAILTGESISTEKNIEVLDKDTSLNDRSNMVYAGTLVTYGRAKAIVVATSINTELGKIANKVLLTKDEKSPLIIRMKKFTKQISVIIAIIAVMLTIFLYLKGMVPREIFFLVVALSISAIPEGLPVILTLALSIASTKMSKNNVIVKKLNSVESLGSCTIIATDKTGTLTLNEQAAKKIVLPNGNNTSITGSGYNGEGKINYTESDENQIKELALLGSINNEASLIYENNNWSNYGDSIDIAFLALGYKANIMKRIKNIETIQSFPYESSKKYSSVFYKEDKTYCTSKGSIEVILSFCTKMLINNKITKIDIEKILMQNEVLAKDGYRVIAICKKEIEEKNSYLESDLKNSTFIGLAAFIDPIRNEVSEAIKKTQNAGIKVVMITGDHPLTSYAIAKELNITNSFDEVISGDKLETIILKDKKELDKFIKNIKVFSRVTPMQKLEIINSYKRQKEFIAVTGDGVNDAPAIKAANIGIAMGSGTSVAKETSTMIITDDNFKSIIAGIEEGRIAYNNVRKVIYFLLSSGVAEILFFMLSILFNLPIPLIAIQLLWVNLVTDGIQDAGLSFEKEYDNVMKEKPRSPNEKIFNKLLIKETLIAGLSIGIIVYIVWHYLLIYKNVDVELARSYILILMVFIQNIHVFNCRNENTSAFKIPFKNNPFVIISVIITIILQTIIIHSKTLSDILNLKMLPYKDIFIMFLLSLPILLIMEIFKKHKKE